MKNKRNKWIKENWFQLIIVTAILIGGVGVGYNFGIVQPQLDRDYLEMQQDEMELRDQIQVDKKNKEEQATLIRQQKEEEEAVTAQLREEWVNSCISDAYVELKTLQNTYDAMNLSWCVKNTSTCDYSRKQTDTAKKEAFQTYQNEWVPQCELGNRVFIDYDVINVGDLL